MGKILRKPKILLFLLIILSNSCQLTTSGGENKSLINEDVSESQNNEKKIVEKIEDKSNEDIVKKTQKKNKEDKRILDFFNDLFDPENEEKPIVTKKKQQEKEKKLKTATFKENQSNVKKTANSDLQRNDINVEEDNKEKRILDFFSKLFKPNEQDEEKIKSELNSEKPIKLKKPSTKPSEKKENFVEKAIPFEIKEIPNESNISTEETDSFKSSKNNPDELGNTLASKKDLNQENTSKITVKVEPKKEELAVLNIKPKELKKELRRDPVNNYVGLLLPLTGEKRSAGKLVLDTFRYSLATNPKNIIFKIYDTKGTAGGAIEAAKKGKNDDVRIFIGPVFSYETAAIKTSFQYDKNIKFFSLSPDLSNISNNIIVSGQNPKDQISCIVNDLSKKDIRKILLIHHDDRYGEVIKESLKESLDKISSFQNIDLSYFTVFPGQNINKDIMEISNFEERKQALKNKRKLLEKDKTIDVSEKKFQLKKLERQLTLGVPFDSIIIASEGDRLTEILSHLAFYDMNSSNTLIYGTSLWEDTIKNDKVFDNTFFVSNLKSKGTEFIKNYSNVFQKNPTTVSFHLFDLIDLVDEFKFYENYPDDKIHVGEFSNTKLNSGSLKRETFIKKNIGKNQTKNIFSCRLNAI
jgi:hypothetical protein